MEYKEKCRVRWLLERVWVWYFLCNRTLKLPSSINEPSCIRLQDSGENGAKKKRLILNHDWLVNIFYCISYMHYHFNVWFFSLQTDAFLTVYVWCCGLVTVTGIFLITMQSGLVLLDASRRDFCHIANDLIMWKQWIPSPLQSTAKFNFPVS